MLKKRIFWRLKEITWPPVNKLEVIFRLFCTLWFQKEEGKKMTRLENGLKIGLFLISFKAEDLYWALHRIFETRIWGSTITNLRPFSSRVIIYPVVALFWNRRELSIYFLRSPGLKPLLATKCGHYIVTTLLTTLCWSHLILKRVQMLQMYRS